MSTDRQIQIVADSRIVRFSCPGYNVTPQRFVEKSSSRICGPNTIVRSTVASPKNRNS